MLHLFGKKYPERAAEEENAKGQESLFQKREQMKCVYAGPEQMGMEREPMKCVYAGPEQMRNDHLV